MPELNEISRLFDEILQEEFEMCENLFLAGFSQGGVTSIYTGPGSTT
jgi:predicted esterase